MSQGQILAAVELVSHEALVCPGNHKKTCHTGRLSLERTYQMSLHTPPSLPSLRDNKERALHDSIFVVVPGKKSPV